MSGGPGRKRRLLYGRKKRGSPRWPSFCRAPARARAETGRSGCDWPGTRRGRCSPRAREGTRAPPAATRVRRCRWAPGILAVVEPRDGEADQDRHVDREHDQRQRQDHQRPAPGVVAQEHVLDHPGDHDVREQRPLARPARTAPSRTPSRATSSTMLIASSTAEAASSTIAGVSGTWLGMWLAR